MAKIKYDVSDVDPGQDFDTPIPRGAYKCIIVDVQEGTSSNDNEMLTVEYEVATGEHKGRKLWDYIVLTDEAAWKMAQFVAALGKKAKGTLDTQAVIGTVVIVKVKHQPDNRPESVEANGGKAPIQARVGSVLPVPEDDDEDLDDEVDEDGGDDGDDDDADASDEDDDDEELTYEELAEIDDMDELKEIIEEYELDVNVTKRSKVPTIIGKIAEALELEPADEEDEDEEDDDEEGEDLTFEDLEEMDLDELKELIEEDDDLDIRVTARSKEATLRQKIAAAYDLEPADDEDGDDEEDDDEEGDEEEVDYSEMGIGDLTTALKERGLNTQTKLKGARKKSLYIKRLEKDDADGGDPF